MSLALKITRLVASVMVSGGTSFGLVFLIMLQQNIGWRDAAVAGGISALTTVAGLLSKSPLVDFEKPPIAAGK